MAKNEQQEDNRLVWTTEKVNQTIEAIENGYNITEHPFHEGDQNYKKSNISFEYTDFEMSEIKKCARDIVYYANTYCQVMTDEGYMKIKLRPYQETILNNCKAYRQNIVLAPRQVGKCLTFDSTVYILDNGIHKKILLGELYYICLKNIRSLTIIENIKFFLWKFYSKL